MRSQYRGDWRLGWHCRVKLPQDGQKKGGSLGQTVIFPCTIFSYMECGEYSFLTLYKVFSVANALRQSGRTQLLR